MDSVTHDDVATLVGASDERGLGWSVVLVGDVDLDGREDVLVSAPREPTSNGYSDSASYLVYGQDLSAGSSHSIGDVSVRFGDETNVGVNYYQPRMGVSARHIGDINDDGASDLLLPKSNGLDPSGETTGWLAILLGGGL